MTTITARAHRGALQPVEIMRVKLRTTHIMNKSLLFIISFIISFVAVAR